ncbi:TPA: phosphoribosyltransferase-like protein [Yersinia enterocolitica]
MKLKNSKGRGDNALTYIFHHSTPNNNLALLWYEDENWTYLFKR